MGVLTVQLGKATGCRVVAIDLDRERAESARHFGADFCLCSADRDTASRLREFARYGADAAIVTAASSTADPIELAADISRERGRIVRGAIRDTLARSK